ncbi:type II toxin-antitoxin system VapC family toxin [Sedimentitalea sp. JM2-8]|uniref:Ribonuclease VapC n=1 Tax=Sedimentitalea xiamensis TaxID=3050037 RepID=A0ABT7FJW5_9RHOB|nr:type II toxin-antitoxin system VapC family toxin [Sedimentitalea xiamensis]MDK3075429.1 type II toxin-antitoxin system VapC family toxin [Sedimentitalea xiamensis]
MYILDTNVISAARRPERHDRLAIWLHAQREDELFLSVITIGEISRGIRQQEKINPGFAADLKDWLNRTETLFQDRVLPFTSRDAQIWGVLSADIGHAGADLMIAASALSHQATVVTRNVSDFEPTGADVLNPF